MQPDRANEFCFVRRMQIANRTIQIILGLILMATLNYLSDRKSVV